MAECGVDRPYWRCYYANTHVRRPISSHPLFHSSQKRTLKSSLSQAIIYVIDASDHDRLTTSRAELLTMLSEEELKDVPLLVFGNKQDIAGALKPGDLSDKLGLAGGEKTRQWSVRGSCAKSGEGLEEGLDW